MASLNQQHGINSILGLKHPLVNPAERINIKQKSFNALVRKFD